MEEVLRIREITKRGQNARYNNIELTNGENVARCTVTPCMIRSNNQTGEADNITFVSDTPHNRSVFLQKKDVEVSVYKDGKWVLIPSSWLDEAFAPTEGGFIAQPSLGKDNAPAKKQKPIQITCFADFEKLAKGMQGKAFQALLRDKNSEMLEEILRGIRINKSNPNIAKSVIDLSNEC